MKGLTQLVLVAALSGSAMQLAHADACSSLSDLEWIVGEWFEPGEKKTTNESWTRTDSGSYQGKGWTMETRTGEIRFSESGIVNPWLTHILSMSSMSGIARSN